MTCSTGLAWPGACKDSGVPRPVDFERGGVRRAKAAAAAARRPAARTARRSRTSRPCPRPGHTPTDSTTSDKTRSTRLPPVPRTCAAAPSRSDSLVSGLLVLPVRALFRRSSPSRRAAPARAPWLAPSGARSAPGSRPTSSRWSTRCRRGRRFGAPDLAAAGVPVAPGRPRSPPLPTLTPPPPSHPP